MDQTLKKIKNLSPALLKRWAENKGAGCPDGRPVSFIDWVTRDQMLVPWGERAPLEYSLVSEFKLTVVSIARPNPMQICACVWI